MEPKKLEKFMNVWEIESNFKCPVVGAMLSVEKHKNILKKCGYNVKHMKPYEYHRHIMSRLDKENNVSRKVNNYIRNQARKYMVMILDQPEKKIRTLWEEKLKSGDVGPMMYAVVAYQDSGIELLNDIHGEVHMLSHANMTEVFNAKKKLTVQETAVINAKKNIQSQKAQIKELIKVQKKHLEKIDALQAENRKLQKLVSEKEKTEDYQDIQVPIDEKTYQDIMDKLDSQNEKIRIKEREKRSLEIRLFSTERENDDLKKEIKHFLSNFKTCCIPPECRENNHCIGDTCNQYQLCAKRVFMVGGMTKMKSYYQKIVENAGGEFHYHDGYLKNGKTNFEAFVKRCDVVICPVNCNSHNACLKVKKLCNQYNKPVKFLNSSSLSTITQALFKPEESSSIIN